MRFDQPTRLIGSRGSRRSAGVRFIPPRPEPPRVQEVARPAPPVRHGGAWIDTLRRFLRRRHPAPAAPTRVAVDAPIRADTPPGSSDLERGLRDIRQTDAGFDPSRFAGYAGMVFRLAQGAWMTRDIDSLRDRVTPELHDALQAQCDRVRSTGRMNRVAEIEITATVTEAWQESDRDYVTAYIEGSIVDYTVDEASDRLVSGSKTVPRGVEEFWTFTRPAGLNFWMLSAIQTA